jgi:hypothetical protein
MFAPGSGVAGVNPADFASLNRNRHEVDISGQVSVRQTRQETKPLFFLALNRQVTVCGEDLWIDPLDE